MSITALYFLLPDSLDGNSRRERSNAMFVLRNPETPEGNTQLPWGNNVTCGYNPKSQLKEQILISCLMTWQGRPPLCFSIFVLCETERKQTQLRCTIQSIKKTEKQFQERREGKEGKEGKETGEHVKRNWVALSSIYEMQITTQLKTVASSQFSCIFFFLNPKGQEITHWSWRTGNYLRGMFL